MFESKISVEQAGKIQKVHLYDSGTELSFRHTYNLWQTDESFRNFFTGMLNDAPYESFRWETPAVDISTVEQEFECVILDSPYLSKIANPQPFSKYFQENQRGAEILVFPNLGKDAIMIVPTPKVKTNVYAQMATFIRQADSSQIHAMWIAIGKTMKENLGPKKIWLNTAGAGVAWLHIRLDSRPKYYHYLPYRGDNLREREWETT